MVWCSNIQIITALMEIIGKFAISQMLFHLHNDFSAFLSVTLLRKMIKYKDITDLYYSGITLMCFHPFIGGINYNITH